MYSTYNIITRKYYNPLWFAEPSNVEQKTSLTSNGQQWFNHMQKKNPLENNENQIRKMCVQLGCF